MLILPNYCCYVFIFSVFIVSVQYVSVGDLVLLAHVPQLHILWNGNLHEIDRAEKNYQNKSDVIYHSMVLLVVILLVLWVTNLGSFFLFCSCRSHILGRNRVCAIILPWEFVPSFVSFSGRYVSKEAFSSSYLHLLWVYGHELEDWSFFIQNVKIFVLWSSVFSSILNHKYCSSFRNYLSHCLLD